MAVLTPSELAQLRRKVAKHVFSVPWSKAEINGALQVVEDRLDTDRGAFFGLIEAAAPRVFDAAQKKLIVAYVVMRFAFGEGAVN